MADTQVIFESTGAVMRGHFLLSSGRHSPVYWEKFRVLQHPEHAERLCGMIASHFRDSGITTVVGPTTLGVIIAHEVARQLGVHAAYAERGDADGRVIKRNQKLEPGERVLVVDDVITRGGSVRDTMAAAEAMGATVAGVGVLVDRTDADPGLNVPLFSCLKTTAVTYAPDECPLCAAGEPLVKPGGGS